jgi:hypothetical protein
MNDRLGELSENEIELILRYRAARARRMKPMTRFEKITLRIVQVMLVCAILVAGRILYQCKQMIDQGDSYQPTAPLTWILVPKQPVKADANNTPAPAIEGESGVRP